MQKPSTDTVATSSSTTSRSAAASRSASWWPSSSSGTAAMRPSIEARSASEKEGTVRVRTRRSHGSRAASHVLEQRSRIPPMSGCSTTPATGMPSGRACTAGTSSPSTRNVTVSTVTSWTGPSRNAAIPRESTDRGAVSERSAANSPSKRRSQLLSAPAGERATERASNSYAQLLHPLAPDAVSERQRAKSPSERRGDLLAAEGRHSADRASDKGEM